ncbi:alpha/beta hydrolase [Saccharopolyspora pogona]|uniref:alpha/beta hydrolase n=1 Tax=Saccharopolyspora pogona TaxID=333966 RepID=UPI001CC2316E|nr:alpha/beta hydrolase-fold protein [Saccharopolyspora pogona]
MNQQIAEQATEDASLITVHPNGVRSWYSNWVDPGSLGPQNWETFHLDQVLPLIDANLRTIPTREGRAIVGHPMGGFGAFHYAEHRPELFSYVGSFSGGLDLLNQAQRAAVIATSVLPESACRRWPPRRSSGRRCGRWTGYGTRRARPSTSNRCAAWAWPCTPATAAT